MVAFLIALAADAAWRRRPRWDNAGQAIAGATLLVAAVYELTPLKDVCLGKCRSPLGTLLGSWRDGWLGRLRMGAERRLVRRLLLGADGVALRAGRHERDLDGRRRRADRDREDDPVAPSAVYGTAIVLLVLGVFILVAPGALPGLTVPARTHAHDGVRRDIAPTTPAPALPPLAPRRDRPL